MTYSILFNRFSLLTVKIIERRKTDFCKQVEKEIEGRGQYILDNCIIMLLSVRGRGSVGGIYNWVSLCCSFIFRFSSE